LERSFPVILAYFSKASVINRSLELEDVEVACSADDMKATDRSPFTMIRPEGTVLRKGNMGSLFRVRIDGRAKDAGGLISSPKNLCPAWLIITPTVSASSEFNMLRSGPATHKDF
jgi:hypothetical protein